MNKFIILVMLLCSCVYKSPFVNSEKAKEHGKHIYKYLQKASHLNDEQKTAMMSYQPFLGMTIDEAMISMRQIRKPEITFNSKVLQAVFIGRWGTKYV